MWWMALIQAVKSAQQEAQNVSNTSSDYINQADTVLSQGKVEAKKIKAQGYSMAGSARAAAAENGLDVDSGSAAMIQDQLVGDAAGNASLTKSQSEYASSQLNAMANDSRNSFLGSKLGPMKFMAKGWKW